jgi:glycine/D-amino acid oxidase-like deaminating enzyme
MDLKSENLFWPAQNAGASREYPALQQDLRCDVAVIGAGLTGALVGYELAQAGVEVVLLDKRNVAEGSTSASTALILYEIDTPLFRLIRMRGERAAVRSYKLCWEAVNRIEQLAHEVGNDCGFQRKSSLYCARSQNHVRTLQQELRARSRAGFATRLLSTADLREHFSLRAPGALLSEQAAQIDPYRFTHRLVERAQANGLRAFGRTRVVRVEPGRGQVVLQTAEGNRIKARVAVLAAGYESQEYLRRKLVKLKSTYAVATAPVEGMGPGFQRCLIWDTGKPYYYLRTTADQRVLIGGEDEEFVNPEKRDRLVADKAERLRDQICKWSPALSAEVEYAWAGTFGETRDGLPYIGCARGAPSLLFALCYGANGTNFAAIAAELIRDKLLGRRHPEVNLFSLDR